MGVLESIRLYTEDLTDYAASRVRDIVSVKDQRDSNIDGIDQLENVETFRFSDGKNDLEQLNKGPVLTGEQAALDDGYKNWKYVINESDLLRGYTDANKIA